MTDETPRCQCAQHDGFTCGDLLADACPDHAAFCCDCVDDCGVEF